MHTFLPAVLLRVSRPDPFDSDSQPEPADGELAPVEQGLGGSEGNAIIAADIGRQAALLKKPLQQGNSKLFPGEPRASQHNR